MSRDRKIILSVILGLFGVCLCCVCAGLVMGTVGLGQMADYLEKNMNEDPQAVATAGAQVATFDLPEGYTPNMSTSIMGITMIAYQGPEADSIIMFMQYPAYAQLDQQQMQEQMQAVLQSQSLNFGNMTVVDQVEITIKGQPATLIISQAEDKQNGRMRQAVTTFEGNNGVVMLMIMGREANWDQAAVDAFLASIR